MNSANMKRHAYLILTIMVLASALVFVNSAHAITIGGQTVNSVTLATNTEWSIDDSPVNFDESVYVPSNVTLTIDPGVTVNMGTYSLQVYGTLIAQGNPNNQITFTASNISNSSVNYLGGVTAAIYFDQQSTPWSSSSSSGCIIQNAVLNAVNLQLSDSSPKIDSCTFNFVSPYIQPIGTSGGSPTISNCIIDYNVQTGSYVANINCMSVFGGSPTIANNTFECDYYNYGSNDIYVNSGSPIITGNSFEGEYSNNDSRGITVSTGTPQITNNLFKGNDYLTGIFDSSSSFFTVSGNVFSNCLSGVNTQQGSSLNVQGNQFLSGTDGIDIASGASLTATDNLIDSNLRFGINGGGIIESNTITNNQVGIHNPPTGIISYNNIVGNTENSIQATTANINAQNNWWGIADAQTINQTIYDSKIDPSLGAITFVPFLTQPSQSAPAIPSQTPTITPAPTAVLTPSPTSEPIITLETPAPKTNGYSQTFPYQVGSMVNLDLIATYTAIVLIVVWVIVIIGYAVKEGISKLRTNN